MFSVLSGPSELCRLLIKHGFHGTSCPSTEQILENNNIYTPPSLIYLFFMVKKQYTKPVGYVREVCITLFHTCLESGNGVR